VSGDDFQPGELQAIQFHLSKLPEHKCSQCGHTTWTATPPQTTLSYRTARPGVPALVDTDDGLHIPVILVICERCYFVRTFAWLPIWRAYKQAVGMVAPTFEGGGHG